MPEKAVQNISFCQIRFSVGSHFSIQWPHWSQLYTVSSEATLLGAHHGCQHQCLCLCEWATPSQSKSVILIILDWFSKMVPFIVLSKLPTTHETPDLVQNIFQIHEIPTDIVDDLGPQLISQVWRSFCQAPIIWLPPQNQWPDKVGQPRPGSCALWDLASQNPSSRSIHTPPWIKYAHNSLTSTPSGTVFTFQMFLYLLS